jgi:hypothetical protein
MNVPTGVVRQAIESLRGTPFVLALVILNIVSLLGFWMVLHSVSEAMERREPLLRACIERNNR